MHNKTCENEHRMFCKVTKSFPEFRGCNWHSGLADPGLGWCAMF